MASRFQTAKLNFIDDIAYKVPYEEIVNVIDKKDSEIDQAQTAGDEMNDFLGDIQRLAQDDEFAKTILDQYGNEINSILERVNDGVSQYNSGKIQSDMNSLQRKMKRDYSTGHLNSILKGYEYVTKAREAIASSKADADDQNLQQRYIDYKYNKAGGAKNQAFKEFAEGTITPLQSDRMDIAKQGQYLESLRSSKQSYSKDGVSGRWIITQGGSTESWDANKIRQNAEIHFKTEMEDEFRRKYSMLGEMEGLEGKELEEYVNSNTNNEKAKFISHADNMFARTNTTSVSSRREDPAAARADGEARQKRLMRFGKRLEEENNEFATVAFASEAKTDTKYGDKEATVIQKHLHGMYAKKENESDTQYFERIRNLKNSDPNFVSDLANRADISEAEVLNYLEDSKKITSFGPKHPKYGVIQANITHGVGVFTVKDPASVNYDPTQIGNLYPFEKALHQNMSGQLDPRLLNDKGVPVDGYNIRIPELDEEGNPTGGIKYKRLDSNELEQYIKSKGELSEVETMRNYQSAINAGVKVYLKVKDSETEDNPDGVYIPKTVYWTKSTNEGR